MSDPDPRDDAAARYLPDVDPDAPSAAAAGEVPRSADGEAPPVPVTAWTTPEDAEELARGLTARMSNPAEWAFVRLGRLIEDYEKSLSPEEEIGARLVGAPGDQTFHIQDLGFWGPDLILFYGKNQHGRPVRLIQHYEHLNVLLTSLPREKDEPRRIGFVLREKLEKAAAQNAPAPAAAPSAE
ncbi:MAG TPA: DUF6173 family protein [Caulobacteraceae bacterium]|nr:DUF6173 family protein [Caulobacteraceae bacterium]